MSSGYGLKGNVGRCFYHFQDFASCMKTSDDPLKECHVLRDDYLECLHHRKEYLRNEVIKKQEIKNKTGDSGHNSHGSHGGGH